MAVRINWLIFLCSVWALKANGVVVSSGHLLCPFSTATTLPMFNELNSGYADWEWNFSFAHITDLQDNSQLDKVTEVVNWIIANQSAYKIKFVVFTGDIVTSCILEHFQNVRDRLQPLIDSAIPYVIVPGNHDMWEYTDTSECQYPNNNAYFREVFGPVLDWARDSSEFTNWDDGIRNTQLWNEDADAVDTNDLGAWNYFQCYKFDYGTYNFVVMDLNTQDHATTGKGANPYAQKYTWVTDGPYDFLSNHLATNASQYTHDRIVIFIHQLWESTVWPTIGFCWKTWFDQWAIGDLLLPYQEQIGAWICGHDHNNDVRDVVYNGQVICPQYTTNALNIDNPISNALRIFKCYGPPPGVEETEVRSQKLEFYPNPFSEKTVIRYSLNVNCGDYTSDGLRLTINDLSGRLIREFTINDSPESNSGLTINEITWEWRDVYGNIVPAGVYFCRLVCGNFNERKKLVKVLK